MQLRSSYTSLHQKVPPDAGLGHSYEAQGYSVGTEREGAVRSDTRERDSPIDSLRIFRQACKHCLTLGRHAQKRNSGFRSWWTSHWPPMAHNGLCSVVLNASTAVHTRRLVLLRISKHAATRSILVHKERLHY